MESGSGPSGTGSCSSTDETCSKISPREPPMDMFEIHSSLEVESPLDFPWLKDTLESSGSDSSTSNSNYAESILENSGPATVPVEYSRSIWCSEKEDENNVFTTPRHILFPEKTEPISTQVHSTASESITLAYAWNVPPEVTVSSSDQQLLTCPSNGEATGAPVPIGTDLMEKFEPPPAPNIRPNLSHAYEHTTSSGSREQSQSRSSPPSRQNTYLDNSILLHMNRSLQSQPELSSNNGQAQNTSKRVINTSEHLNENSWNWKRAKRGHRNDEEYEDE